jgi:hypothetical protein
MNPTAAAATVNLQPASLPGYGTLFIDAQGNYYGWNGTSFTPNAGAQAAAAASKTTTAPSTLATTSSGISATSGPLAAPKTPTYVPPPAPAYVNPNAAIAQLPDLGSGSTGADVTTLQNWLVANGYMTQAQMNTGPGTYGAQTEQAVTNFQTVNGIQTQGNNGYWGPITENFITSNPTLKTVNGTVVANAQPLSGTSGTTGTGTSGTTGTTGDTGTTGTTGTTATSLATIEAEMVAAMTAAGIPQSEITAWETSYNELGTQAQNLASTGQLPASLAITPVLTQQFLAWATQNVSPQTQENINAVIAPLNEALSTQQQQYENQQALTIQQFGVQLNNQDNSFGASGFGDSGLRNLTDRNLVNATNWTLSSAQAAAANQASQALNTGAGEVGSQNANQFAVPSLLGATVSNTGGTYGSSTQGSNANLNYTPSNYTVGTIPSQGNTTTGNLAANYLGQYTTLAAYAPTNATAASIIPGITNLPAGYTVPSSLT